MSALPLYLNALSIICGAVLQKIENTVNDVLIATIKTKAKS